MQTKGLVTHRYSLQKILFFHWEKRRQKRVIRLKRWVVFPQKTKQTVKPFTEIWSSLKPARSSPLVKAESISRLGKRMQASMDRSAGFEKHPGKKAVSHQ